MIVLLQLQLVEVMDNAKAQLMNKAGYSNDYSKSILTKSDLLEKAVELVKQLADENKKLRMVSIVVELYVVIEHICYCLLFY
jgi:DNA repair photolyase